MLKLALSSAMAIATAIPAFADPMPAAPPPPAAQPIAATAMTPAKPNAEDKVICKTETPTGSRLGGHRVCMKKSDWEAQATNARQQREFQGGPAGIGGSH